MGDWIRAVSDVVQTVAVVVASGTAIWGIVQWRRQMITQRRMGLAEEVLSAFYEAQQVIRAARSPMSFGGEGRGWRGPAEKEDDDLKYSSIDAYYAPAERLFKKQEFFAKLHALEFRFLAVYGAEKQEYFQVIWSARNSVIISSQELAWEGRRALDSAKGLDPEERKKLKVDIWTHNEEDEISRKIIGAVGAVESICRPELTKWFKL